MLKYQNTCRSGGMVYTCDSKSHALRLVGSSPTFGTKKNTHIYKNKIVTMCIIKN